MYWLFFTSCWGGGKFFFVFFNLLNYYNHPHYCCYLLKLLFYLISEIYIEITWWNFYTWRRAISTWGPYHDSSFWTVSAGQQVCVHYLLYSHLKWMRILGRKFISWFYVLISSFLFVNGLGWMWKESNLFHDYLPDTLFIWMPIFLWEEEEEEERGHCSRVPDYWEKQLRLGHIWCRCSSLPSQKRKKGGKLCVTLAMEVLFTCELWYLVTD